MGTGWLRPRLEFLSFISIEDSLNVCSPELTPCRSHRVDRFLDFLPWPDASSPWRKCVRAKMGDCHPILGRGTALFPRLVWRENR